MKILCIAGSIREASLNRKLLRNAVELVPDGVECVVFELNDIPLYNADQDGETQPEPVIRFKQAIANADALLIANPEYNASFTGVLKNAIDWASRPIESTPLMNKPVAVIGVSGGMSGTIRAQTALLPVLAACGVRVMPKPNVVIRQGAKFFDENGRLTDQDTRDQLERVVHGLVDWTRRLDS